MDEQFQILRRVRLALQDGDFINAIRHLEQVVKLARERGDRGAEGRHLGNLALTYYRLGNPKQAFAHFQQALSLVEEDGDKFTQNGLLGNMGNVLRELDRHAEAEDYLNRALILSQELGDRRGRGLWLQNLAIVYMEQHRAEEAIPLLEDSVRIARKLHDQQSLATRLDYLADAYAAQQDLAQAAETVLDAAEVHYQLKQIDECAFAIGMAGNFYADLGRIMLPSEAAYDHFSKALDLYGRAMDFMRQLKDQASEAEIIRNVGMVLADAGQLDDAAHYLDVAQRMFETLGLRREARMSRNTLQRLIDFLEDQQPAGSQDG